MELPIADESGKMVVEMRGKCFNATLTVEKHEKRCPWCIEHNEVAIVGQQVSNVHFRLELFFRAKLTLLLPLQLWFLCFP